MKQHDGFIKNSDVNVLLAGGGHKPLSDFLFPSDADNLYLKKAGDTMYGPIYFSNNLSLSPWIFCNSNELSMTWNYTKREGAGFSAYNAKVTNASDKGVFYVWADDGTTRKHLKGYPDGRLTWEGASLLHTGNIGSYAAAVNHTHSLYLDKTTGVLLYLYSAGCELTGWYRVWRGTNRWTEGNWALLHVFRSYGNNNSESYTFCICSSWYNIKCTQIISAVNQHLMTKVRVCWEGNSYYYIDVYWEGNRNTFYVGSLGLLGEAMPIEYLGSASSGSILEFPTYSNSEYVSGPVYASAFNSTSDISKKFNILSISNIFPIYSFNWKDSNKKSYGFIAQYLENLGLPEIVSGPEGNKAVNYAEALSYYLAKLSNIVIEKDLATNSRINLLEKRILELENKINTN